MPLTEPNIMNLRKASRAVYLACESEVADDISNLLKWSADQVESLSGALASQPLNAPSPAMKWARREEIAKAIYDLSPDEDGGEYVDGFCVSPGGKITWEQAKAWDAEFAPEHAPSRTAFAYAAADAALSRS